ncbi:tetraspanin-1-like [Brienomyrus brachyistius]|uniref:tetraspanin-1-like n=1 Tax=Brienomyrus brachyistius TaxID=42636 RepID=UPI0020B41719|nr:tetraspanin-1-like [Brienomyrus brachyistius]XP_048870129.1 tetraspanin-1-like [Brienomyrus brachyistius]
MCCSDFLRVIMVAFNGIIFVAGAAILGVGIWVKVDSGSLLKILEQVENTPAELNQIFYVGYLLIAVGSVLVLLGFLGCCGAIRKSPCMLLTFFIIVLLVFIAEVSGAIVILVFKPLVDTLIEKIGHEAVQRIKVDYGKNPNFTEVWNATMDGLHCCGFYNYTDFTDSPFYKNNGHSYPRMCCDKSPCNLQTADTSNVSGCYFELVNLIENNAVILGAVALGIAALEIAAMAVSMQLYRKSSQEH